MQVRFVRIIALGMILVAATKVVPLMCRYLSASLQTAASIAAHCSVSVQLHVRQAVDMQFKALCHMQYNYVQPKNLSCRCVMLLSCKQHCPVSLFRINHHLQQSFSNRQLLLAPLTACDLQRSAANRVSKLAENDESLQELIAAGVCPRLLAMLKADVEPGM